MPVLIYLAIWVFAIIGYICNIVGLINCDFKPSYKAEIIRSVGIVAPPVGAVVGYMQIKDIKE